MSTHTKDDDTAQDEETNDETQVAAIKSSNETNDDEKEKMTATTTTTEDQEKVLDDDEKREAALHPNAIVCSFCGLPQTEARSFSKTKCPCKSTRYCNTTCQKKHWKMHRNDCQHLVAEIKRKKRMEEERQREQNSAADTISTTTTTTTSVKEDKSGALPKKDEVNDDGEEKTKTTEEEEKTKEKEEEGDECPICLENLSKDTSKFIRLACCGQGMHIHCNKDLHSMKMARTCPLCRAKTPTSDEEHIKYLRPWVKKKKVWAQNLMAQKYRDGKGVKQSYEMARMLYEQSAQQGNADAMGNLGAMYAQGHGVEQSYEKAKEYFEKAADLGDATAQYNLGLMFYLGHNGVKKDTTKAREWWTKAAAQGHEHAIKNLKILDKEEGQTTTASTSTSSFSSEEKTKTTEEEEKTKEKEEEGDECPICLEVVSTNGNGYSRWSCCGKGIHNHCFKDMKSMSMAGNCPFCRAKTPSSHEEIVKQLHPWVKKKKAWAQTQMGQKYKHGEGVKQSYQMARILYEQAAQQGDASAMCNLGIMYANGEGVEQSYEKAKEYLQQAAQLGDAGAQCNLGCMYANGLGVSKDTMKAHALWTASAAQGNETATNGLQWLKTKHLNKRKVCE